MSDAPVVESRTSNKRLVTEEEFNEWLELSVTKAFFKATDYQGKQRREHLESGCWLSYPQDELARLYIRTVEQAQVYESIKSVDLESINDAIEES